MVEVNNPMMKLDQDFILEYIEDVQEMAKGIDILSDPPEVHVGRTPSEVIYSENGIKLLHYRQPDPDAHKEPILMVYALVNKPYILDLQPNRSVIGNLLKQGFDIFLIDWGEPDEKDMYMGMDDYINYFIDLFVDKVRKETEHDKINILGYCQGGTFSAIYTSLHKEKVKNLILMAAPLVTNHEAGMLNKWSKKEYFDPDKVVDVFENVPAEFLNGGFLLLDPVGNLIGKYLKFFERADNEDFVKMFLRMERWINDGISVAGKTYREFIKAIYQENKLVKNELELDGKKVDVKNIDIPVLFLVGEHDHLVPLETTVEFADHIGSRDIKIIRNDTGHIGLSVSSKSHKGMWQEVGDWLLDRIAEEDEEIEERPLSSIKGIGTSYEERLNEAGIVDIKDLVYTDIDDLIDKTGISKKRLERWKKSVEEEQS